MAVYHSTKLWETSLVPRPNDAQEGARSRLRVALEHMRERASVLAAEIGASMPSLTVHDVSHLDHLWVVADLIAGPGVSLSPNEAFVLGAAFLLHDLGLGLAAYPDSAASLQDTVLWRDALASTLRQRLGRQPSRGELEHPPADVVDHVLFLVLRERHALRAEELACATWQDGDRQYFLLEDADLRHALGGMIGRLAHSHWWPTSRLPEEFPHELGAPLAWQPEEWRIDPLKLALLLRLSDAADVSVVRAPSFLRILRRPQGTSGLHWRFQEHLYGLQRKGDWLVYTSKPFAATDAPAWWLCYDTLRMVDAELRGADALNSDLGRERFAARGVRGAEDPQRLAVFIPVQGWSPFDAQVRVSSVAGLVEKLGGRALYGDDNTIPLRELLQNAADAVRARRLLEERDQRWGSIVLRTGMDEHGAWVEVHDNGVGMSERVLLGALLDFGVSLWHTPEAVREFPTLAARAFSSTGQYGIGFFSVFMWSDMVRVTTRRFDRGLSDTFVLEFAAGLSERPLLRQATNSEQARDGGTIVRVWPRNVTNTRSPWLQYRSSGQALSVSEAASWLCLTPDVDVFIEDERGKQQSVARAGDWLRIPGESLLSRISPRGTYGLFAKNLRPLKEGGVVVGRACVMPGFYTEGAISVGGLRAKTTTHITGILLGASERASREAASVIVSSRAFARWATKQATMIARMPLSVSDQAACARIVGVCGGDIGSLPIAKPAGDNDWLGKDGIMAWCREKDCIDVVSEGHEEDILAGGSVTDVLIEPDGPDNIPPSTARRPLLDAIASAWAPDSLVLQQSERYVQVYAGTKSSRYDGFTVRCEEIRRLPVERV